MKKINDESEKINQPSAASDTVDTEDGIYFNINHVAKTLDIVPATIRNWEKAGLFTAKRRGNNYRVFDINDIALLRRIKKYSVEENMSMSLIKKFWPTILSPPDRSSRSIPSRYITANSGNTVKSAAIRWKTPPVS